MGIQARQALLLSGTLSHSPENEFEIACCHAALAMLVGQPNSGVSAAQEEEEVNMAMEHLAGAVAKGYRNLNEIRIESAFDTLRKRSEFKKLMVELEKNAPPQR